MGLRPVSPHTVERGPQKNALVGSVRIDLAPEAVAHARCVRHRFQKLGVLVLVLLGVYVGAGLVEQVVTVVSGQRRSQEVALARDVSSLREVLKVRQRDVEAWQAHHEQRQNAARSQARVARHMLSLPELLPAHVTLSSLYIAESHTVCSGVAGVRSDVGELVGAMKAQEGVRTVSVESLKDTAVGRHVLQEFVIRTEEVDE